MGKRATDLIFAILGFSLFLIPGMLIALLIKFSSKGPIIHWSRRAGVNDELFSMPKFRTMYLETPDLATDKLKNSENYVTPLGKVLRKTSLDEVPQLFSVLLGQMSIVGPRPALHNQFELIRKRKEIGINKLKPGITGWAQVNGRDVIDEKMKVEFDREYLENAGFVFDLKIIYQTVFTIVQSKNVSH